MGYKFSERSRKRLEGVHPDLVSVLEVAITRTPIDFTVLEGVRSLDRQKKLVAKGTSKTMNSRHLTGHAVDIAPLEDGQVSWHWPHYYEIEPVVKQAARDLGVELEWGGDWQSFKDGPHWQLPWETYGKTDMAARAVSAPERAQPAPPAVEVPEQPKGLWSALWASLAALFGK